ncbi:hypothetical protein [Desulfosporosinus sp. BICA1-9]|uniref:hypothetical protein n=1 Tax=Desulfosporosinus sp. BICA1-9 TaxID=1531958 RepID=UPI00054BBC91|nr:hypothetical protein [Desulfosporosinus sp. BICA1-9]KJS49051.1 MAG: hypothetical protein VR66_10580 [Peptococcaceae bacterium BRH_c23]KJS89792.1 MAG: hypothetical protein JL57_05420 [Desulfosporosinus sp. BICA1-9]
MAVFDTGPIETRAAPRTTQLTIRLFNTGKLPHLLALKHIVSIQLEMDSPVKCSLRSIWFPLIHLAIWV